MPKYKSGDQRVHYSEPADREAEELLAEQAAEQQAVIAPGTNGDPNDPMDDFPMVRYAGEPWAKDRNNKKRRTKTDAGPNTRAEQEVKVFWHGEVDYRASRPQLVQDVIPEVGHGLWSGQWGTFKTFGAL